MVELSVTVTAGEGSEVHNHDLEYRKTLKHVHDREEGIIELIPYRPYQEQINEAMKPFIDEYNAKVDARYQAAWDRYNSGKIKTKPRRRDYKKMGYDYYSDHWEDKCNNPRTGKVEELPMWRSLIIGIGDQEDRRAGRLTEEQAKAIFRKMIEKFKEDFPDFLLLGATLHLDEKGFYHAHVDYKPLYQKEEPDRGLTVGVGQDAALERMGYQPEQSIINGWDKAPLLFNAMRNQIYFRMEEAMAAEKLRLQYGVSQIKEPGKDSSKNQKLGDWQATQDAARDLQHQKNLILSVIDGDYVSETEVKNATEIAVDITKTLDEIEKSPRSRLDKTKGVVEFRLLDQLKSFVTELLGVIGRLLQELNRYKEQQRDYEKLKQQAENGKYYSALDLQTMESKHKLDLEKERQKTSRMEKYLRGTGMPQTKVDLIKNGSRSEDAWDGNFGGK